MTIQELYAEIGGNYEQVIRIMRKDTMVDRYIHKLAGSPAWSALEQAVGSMDEKGIFEQAHALKGVAANLGLTDIAEQAGELCEAYRPGKAPAFSEEETRARFAALSERYRKTLDAIARYDQG